MTSSPPSVGASPDATTGASNSNGVQEAVPGAAKQTVQQAPGVDEQETIRTAAEMMTTGRVTEAEQTLRRLIEQLPDSVPARYSLGMLRLKRGDTAEAVSLLESAVLREPSHVRSLLGLGQAQLRAGDRDSARHCLVEVLRLHPEHRIARAELAALDHAEAATRPTIPRGTASGAAAGPQAGPSASPTGVPSAPAGPPTVSGMLENLDTFDEEGLRGAILERYRRRLSSHVTLFLGVLLAAAAALPGLAANAAHLDPEAQQTLNNSAHTLAILIAAAGVALVGYAVLSSLTTRYAFRERAVDLTSGVVFRKQRTVWLWDVVEVDVVRNPVLLLTGTASLVLFSGSITSPVLGRKPRTRLIGFTSASRMAALRVDLQTRALHERRAMKKQWI